MTTTRRAHPWRRRLTRAALCVLLGAVTTVGVAWGAVALRPGPWQRVDVVLIKAWQTWFIGASRSTGVTNCRLALIEDDGIRHALRRREKPHVSSFWGELTPDIAEAADRTAELLPGETLSGSPLLLALRAPRAVSPAAAPPAQQSVAWTMEAGLPMRAMACVRLTTLQNAQGTQILAASDRGVLYVGELRLPLRPIWPGFLLDTLFYAAALWALLLTLGLVTRWRRKRRGACLACGYDLRGLGDAAACPECGQATRVAARRRPALSDDC